MDAVKFHGLDKRKGGSQFNKEAFKSTRLFFCYVTHVQATLAVSRSTCRLPAFMAGRTRDVFDEFKAKRAAKALPRCACGTCPGRPARGKGTRVAGCSGGMGAKDPAGGEAGPSGRGYRRSRPPSNQTTPGKPGDPHPRRSRRRPPGNDGPSPRRSLLTGSTPGAEGAEGRDGGCAATPSPVRVDSVAAGAWGAGQQGPQAPADVDGTGVSTTPATAAIIRRRPDDASPATLRNIPDWRGHDKDDVDAVPRPDFNKVLHERNFLKEEVDKCRRVIADMGETVECLSAQLEDYEAELQEVTEALAEQPDADAATLATMTAAPREGSRATLTHGHLTKLAAKTPVQRADWSVKTERRSRDRLLRGLDALWDKRYGDGERGGARVTETVRIALHGLVRSGGDLRHVRDGVVAFAMDVLSAKGVSADQVAFDASLDFFKQLPSSGVAGWVRRVVKLMWLTPELLDTAGRTEWLKKAGIDNHRAALEELVAMRERLLQGTMTWDEVMAKLPRADVEALADAVLTDRFPRAEIDAFERILVHENHVIECPDKGGSFSVPVERPSEDTSTSTVEVRNVLLYCTTYADIWQKSRHLFEDAGIKSRGRFERLMRACDWVQKLSTVDSWQCVCPTCFNMRSVAGGVRQLARCFVDRRTLELVPGATLSTPALELCRDLVNSGDPVGVLMAASVCVPPAGAFAPPREIDRAKVHELELTWYPRTTCTSGECMDCRLGRRLQPLLEELSNTAAAPPEAMFDSRTLWVFYGASRTTTHALTPEQYVAHFLDLAWVGKVTEPGFWAKEGDALRTGIDHWWGHHLHTDVVRMWRAQVPLRNIAVIEMDFASKWSLPAAACQTAAVAASKLSIATGHLHIPFFTDGVVRVKKTALAVLADIDDEWANQDASHSALCFAAAIEEAMVQSNVALQGVVLVSDGCADSYKCEAGVYFFARLSNTYGMPMVRVIHREHHGKSMCDKIGHVVSYRFNERALSGGGAPTTAAQWCAWGNENVKTDDRAEIECYTFASVDLGSEEIHGMRNEQARVRLVEPAPWALGKEKSLAEGVSMRFEWMVWPGEIVESMDGSQTGYMVHLSNCPDACEACGRNLATGTTRGCYNVGNTTRASTRAVSTVGGKEVRANRNNGVGRVGRDEREGMPAAQAGGQQGPGRGRPPPRGGGAGGVEIQGGPPDAGVPPEWRRSPVATVSPQLVAECLGASRALVAACAVKEMETKEWGRLRHVSAELPLPLPNDTEAGSVLWCRLDPRVVAEIRKSLDAALSRRPTATGEWVLRDSRAALAAAVRDLAGGGGVIVKAPGDAQVPFKVSEELVLWVAQCHWHSSTASFKGKLGGDSVAVPVPKLRGDHNESTSELHSYSQAHQEVLAHIGLARVSHVQQTVQARLRASRAGAPPVAGAPVPSGPVRDRCAFCEDNHYGAKNCGTRLAPKGCERNRHLRDRSQQRLPAAQAPQPGGIAPLVRPVPLSQPGQTVQLTLVAPPGLTPGTLHDGRRVPTRVAFGQGLAEVVAAPHPPGGASTETPGG